MILHEGPFVPPQPLSLTGPPLVIRDLMMVPTAPDQTAIDLTWPSGESEINTSVIIENVVTAPGNGFHWRDHFHLTNAWNAQITGCNNVGPAGMPNPVSMHGVILDGKSTGVTIARHRISGVVTGIHIKGECEGTKIDDLDAIGVLNGIHANPDSGGGEPGLWISRTHINATNIAIELRHRYQVFLRDLLLYAGDYYQVTKGTPFYGVVLVDCQEVLHAGVKVQRNGAEAARKPITPFHYTRTAAIEGAATMASF
jgi:hypothetical protein